MADTIFKELGGIVGTAINDAKTEAISSANTTLSNIMEVNADGEVDLKKNLVPADATVSLGSIDKPFADVFISQSSLYVNGTKVLSENAGTIDISADPDQNIRISTQGAGDIEFYPSGEGVIQMKGTLSLQAGDNLVSSDGQPINCPVGFGTLTVQNLTVTGTTTTVNTATLNVADNIITLNADVVGNPTENAGIEVERGDENNAKILFNESVDRWQVSNDGVNYSNIGSGAWGEITGTLSNQTDLQAALDGKLATTANAVSATKLQTSRSIALSGDVTGSVNFDGTANVTITTVIADDSHNHTIANVDGLQTALDGKLATTANAVSATKLATARTIALSGDVTGSVSFDGSANATITTVIADDSHNHTIANVDGLQTALDGKSATSHTHDDRYYTESEVGTIAEFDTALAAAMA